MADKDVFGKKAQALAQEVIVALFDHEIEEAEQEIIERKRGNRTA